MKFRDYTGCWIDIGTLLNATYMLSILPQFLANFHQTGMYHITIIEATVVIKGKPATNFSQLVCRKFIECTTHHQFHNCNARWMKNTPQQATFYSELIIRVDEAKSTQGKDRSIQFSSASSTQREIANALP